MVDQAKHAYGTSANIQSALNSGIIDAYDILLLDGDTQPKIGWVDKNGVPRIVQCAAQVITVDGLPDVGNENVIYLYNDKAYIWNGAEYVNISSDVDLSALEAEIATKVSADEVDAKINKAELENVEYEVSHKPEGTIVDYRDKEIRIMCPNDTQWVLQNVGANGDPNRYYIGFKAYAPSNDVVGFKEDIAKTISDETMYSFENNEFAGIDEFGRKYSIVWLPAASYDASTSTWTYFGAKSTVDKYIGWYYSVEWYDANNDIVASDCIKINLSNEECHTSVEPFYVKSAVASAKSYTDEQIAKMAGGIEIVEF